MFEFDLKGSLVNRRVKFEAVRALDYFLHAQKDSVLITQSSDKLTSVNNESLEPQVQFLE